MKLRIGSRGSLLALWQANHIAALLRGQGHSVEIEIIKTTGDKITDVPLAQVGSKGLFTKEIEEALLDKSIDLAVHSLKDLETELPPGIVLACALKREDSRDALILGTNCGPTDPSAPFDCLPASALVGTSSVRRQAQLLHVRPDLNITPIRAPCGRDARLA